MKYIYCKILLLLCLCQFKNTGIAQGLVTGNTFQTISIKKLLNTSTPSSFNAINSKINIIDFFGTWCIPCVKALPHLSKIKEEFKDDVSIVLVSTETEERLTKFINARKISFPVIVDEDNAWNDAFRPPALPYTVVVNKQGKVIAITEAEEITPEAIRAWLSSAGTNDLTATSSPTTNNQNSNLNKLKVNTLNEKSKNTIVQLSQDYIYASKTGEAIEAFTSGLQNLSYESLKNTIKTDDAKKAFWINLYNGYTQAALKAAPDKYKNRNAFFKEKNIEVAGKLYSLDEIEHGILRRSKIKWSMGYFNKLFPGKREKDLRVGKVDYRIHFALNCGAKSCPPIAFYNDEVLEDQLEVATKAYLTSETEYDSSGNIIHLPKLMSWFRGDFGGKKGMLEILKKYGIIQPGAKPKIKFKDYDWTLQLNNYKTENQ